jgi:DNA-directed RNA polymerase subunit beta'
MYQVKGRKFQEFEIGLASPKEIKSWAERFLPNGEVIGEVTSWETVNYKTLKPEPNGLFCQKIFGPISDYTCACGKKTTKSISGICPRCGVERTKSLVRRYRMGYIYLNQPMAHTLYSMQKPSPLGLCLNWPNKKMQGVLYGTEFSHLPTNLNYFCCENDLRIGFKKKFQDLNHFQNQNKPRLFKKIENKKIITEIQNTYVRYFDIKNYGLSYDSTWRQVEDLQNFLIYMWEQPHKSDLLNPYYFFTNKTKNFATSTIPIHSNYYPIQTGGIVFQKVLAHSDLIGLQQQIALDITEVKQSINFLKERIETNWLPRFEKSKINLEITRFKELEKKLLRRITYFRDFYVSEMQPAWMVLSYLPVLPPGLRPITSIRGELVISDLNSLYRKVLTRNRRLINHTQFTVFDTALSGSWASWCYNLRQVQEAIDALLKTGKVESGKVTKSLLDALKGKRGRFRQHLLGKRVDYSGRSVIVVGPQLKIHECGLPKQMAIELFQPFLIQRLRNKGMAFTTIGAKAIIMERKPIIWTLLREILQRHPILLNRAPTLHRLGIQAFIPKLVDGKAILLHPLVCPAFNADFDGDQMAVHIPLSSSARAEAFNLLLASNHLLSPASGQPLLLPTQDMVLGCYYLTLMKFKNLVNLPFFYKTNWYTSISEVLSDYQSNRIHLHTPIWLKWDFTVQNLISEKISKESNKHLEIRLNLNGMKYEYFIDAYKISTYSTSQLKQQKVSFYSRTSPGRVLMNTLIYSN